MKSIEEWENIKTTARYFDKTFRAFLGSPPQKSRQLVAEEDFDKPSKENCLPPSDRDLEKSGTLESSFFSSEEENRRNLEKTTYFSHRYKDASKEYGEVFPLLHFAKDSYKIDRAKDLAALEKIALFLQQKPRAHLLIEGHCDPQDTCPDLIDLGQQRAEHVRLFLLEKGVSKERIYTVSYGIEKPLVQGSSEQSFRLNRRAEFKLFIEE